MTTADASYLYADSSCITADGANNCLLDSYYEDGPMGLGYLLLFQNEVGKSGTGDGSGKRLNRRKQLILQQDQQVLEFIQILVSSRIL